MRPGIHIVRVYALLFWSFAAMSAEPLSLSIHPSHNGAPLLQDSLRYETAGGERYSITRLSYLLSELAFEREDGEWISAESEAGYFDLGSRISNWDTELPAGNYRAARFTVGLPPGLNHSDPASHPPDHALHPDHNRLHWTWATGYIFMALEGRYYQTDGTLSGFVYHFANDHNRVVVNLPLQLEHSKQSQVELSLDVGQLLSFPETIHIAKDGNSTHSREGDPLTGKLKSNLPVAFRVERVRQISEREPVALPTPIDLPETFTPFAFKMGRNFPMPDLPVDNPLIEERVELGEALFFDPILSRNQQISCAGCHVPSLAFSDPARFSSGVSEQTTRRHSMPLFNLAWKERFFWDGRSSSLREQVLHPVQHPVEMGLSLEELERRLKREPTYQRLFAEAFGSGAITSENVALALENYLLTLVSYRSRFDDAMAGRVDLTEEERRGFELFMTEYEPRSKRFGADCFHCHGGALFTDNQFHNNGLRQQWDVGLSEATGRAADNFKFSTPSLRNVALTAPYMHDGGLPTLEAVVQHYSSGIQPSDTLDPNLAKHPVGGIQLSQTDQKALVAFLKTLTDYQFSED